MLDVPQAQVNVETRAVSGNSPQSCPQKLAGCNLRSGQAIADVSLQISSDPTGNLQLASHLFFEIFNKWKSSKLDGNFTTGAANYPKDQGTWMLSSRIASP